MYYINILNELNDNNLLKEKNISLYHEINDYFNLFENKEDNEGIYINLNYKYNNQIYVYKIPIIRVNNLLNNIYIQSFFNSIIQNNKYIIKEMRISFKNFYDDKFYFLNLNILPFYFIIFYYIFYNKNIQENYYELFINTFITKISKLLQENKINSLLINMNETIKEHINNQIILHLHDVIEKKAQLYNNYTNDILINIQEFFYKIRNKDYNIQKQPYILFNRKKKNIQDIICYVNGIDIITKTISDKDNEANATEKSKVIQQYVYDSSELNLYLIQKKMNINTINNEFDDVTKNIKIQIEKYNNRQKNIIKTHIKLDTFTVYCVSSAFNKIDINDNGKHLLEEKTHYQFPCFRSTTYDKCSANHVLYISSEYKPFVLEIEIPIDNNNYIFIGEFGEDKNNEILINTDSYIFIKDITENQIDIYPEVPYIVTHIKCKLENGDFKPPRKGGCKKVASDDRYKKDVILFSISDIIPKNKLHLKSKYISSNDIHSILYNL